MRFGSADEAVARADQDNHRVALRRHFVGCEVGSEGGVQQGCREYHHNCATRHATNVCSAKLQGEVGAERRRDDS